MDYEAVIGLEVHAQLLTDSKIFCGCSTAFGADPNAHTCPVCLGMPGVLPVLNKKVVEYAMRMALATNCIIAKNSRFARKNYFYPDLPKGYQISQYEAPLAEHGALTVTLEDGSERRIGITRIHMEEDAGKLVHDEKKPVSYVDLNRTGVPLIEIVSEPDIRSSEEAAAYLKSLRDILVYLEICDGNMEEGSLRCDANISVRPVGQERLGTRAELKNMNSFRNVKKALDYEIQRQIQIKREGGTVIQETRLWDEERQTTFSMRGKEEAHDYRYFPDPDLVPLKIDEAWISEIRESLPELPEAKRSRFLSQYDLREKDAETLTSSRLLADYFEAVAKEHTDPKTACNWITGELLKHLNQDGKSVSDCPVTPEMFASLLKLLAEGAINRKIAQGVFEQMYKTGEDPKAVIDKQGLAAVSDEGELTAIIDQVIADNPKEVEEFKGGKGKLMGFFMGQVMKLTKGQADPKTAQALFTERLKGE